MDAKCKICNGASNTIFETVVLKKYASKYYQCSNCQFIQTEEPFWLEEAYTSAITTLDIGLLYRNSLLLPITSAIIKKFFNSTRTFLDYGGGYGIFTRLMRDKGFNYFRQDIFCDNIFAKGFDVEDIKTERKFELLTAFEVFEHLSDPVSEVEKMLQLSENIFFSTQLVPERKIAKNDWWYFMPETGQHISLFSKKSLQLLAEKNNLKYYTNGSYLHLFTKKNISPFVFKLLTRYKPARAYNILSPKKKTLLDSDYQSILNSLQQR